MFSLPEYDVFAADVLAHLDEKEMDQNSLIRTALPHLGQQVVDLHVGLTSLMNAGFLKQRELFSLMEGKLDDFLTGKVTFTLTPSKICQLPRATSPIPLNTLDPLLHPPAATTSFSSSPSAHDLPTPRSHRPRSRRSRPHSLTRSPSPSEHALAFFDADVSVELPASSSYFLNRQVCSVVDLWREWTVGLGTGPAMGKLNSSYGSGWRRGWPDKERQYYSQRLTIIEYLTRQARAGSREEMAKQLDSEREVL